MFHCSLVSGSGVITTRSSDRSTTSEASVSTETGIARACSNTKVNRVPGNGADGDAKDIGHRVIAYLSPIERYDSMSNLCCRRRNDIRAGHVGVRFRSFCCLSNSNNSLLLREINQIPSRIQQQAFSFLAHS